MTTDTPKRPDMEARDNFVPKTNLAVSSIGFCYYKSNEGQILGKMSTEKCMAFCV